jgi:lysophospholipase L1-like esterase
LHVLKSFKNSRLLSLLVVFVFLLGIVMPGQTQAVGEKVHYVALGDSLAAGELARPADGVRTWVKGFSGIIAEHFEKNGVLASYTNKFATSGYATQNVLDDIVNNKEVEGKKLKDTLKAANYVTVTAGANDVLQVAEIDIAKGTVSIDPLKFGATNSKIQSNLTSIIKEIQTLNPKAEIYVSGYYNPFPYLPAAQQGQLELMLSLLNGGIKSVSEAKGATFVDMKGIFDASKETYLPNPRDIHPSLEGYQLLANKFIAAYDSKIKFQFEDVPEGYPYYNEIKFVVENRVMTGVSATQFGTKQAITRADTAQALYNILPLEKSIPANPGFSDVPESHPNYMAIAKLTQAGVFQKAEKFNPESPLTRAQMAKVLTLSFQLKATTSSSFKDVKTGDWSKEFVDALFSAKITTGYTGDNTFRPNLATNREQFALFLVRSANNVLQSAN